MLLHPRYLVAILAALVVLAAAAVIAWVGLTGRQTGQVAIPPDDATPAQVVMAYTQALDQHDCATVAALSTSAAVQDGDLWCRGVRTVRDVRITGEFNRRKAAGGHGRSVNVGVVFSLTWRPFHDDGTVGTGQTDWGYRLQRISPTDPWRVSDQGTG